MDEKDKRFKEAVSILYDMEIHNYKMTRTIMRLNYEISCLGNPRKFEKPREPSYYKESLDVVDTAFFPTCIGLMLGALVGLMVGCESTTGVGFFEGITGAFFGSIITGLVFFLTAIFFRFKKNETEADNDYKARFAQYESEMKIYNYDVSRDNIRVKSELKRKKILEAERQSLIERKQKSEEILANFYMRAGIDKMFRKLIPIAKMHEIISLGITYNLDGENGLNDRVRKELREDAFYAKLEEISQKLDTLISKVDRLYGEILNLNSQCENLIGATMQSAQIAANNNVLLSEAVKNTRIAAYNSERIAAEQRYQSFMMTYNF